MNSQIVADNAAVTARLEKLIESLSDDDLAADLGGGWTAHVALGHLAFWDRRIVYVLTRWREQGIPHTEQDDDVINTTLEAILVAMQPREAARLCLESARAANAVIEATPDHIMLTLEAEGHDYLLRRTGHRAEHIDQIEAVVGRRT